VLGKYLVLDNTQSYQEFRRKENIPYLNIEILAQDLLTRVAQQDSLKEENLELLAQVFMIEINRVWLKMESTSFQDLKIVNAEHLAKAKEILGELKKEEETQVRDTIESPLISVTTNLVK